MQNLSDETSVKEKYTQKNNFNFIAYWNEQDFSQ